ncbi:hypothetical protein [Okeania sp. SIO1I7]
MPTEKQALKCFIMCQRITQRIELNIVYF